jgi:hypothetical protein
MVVALSVGLTALILVLLAWYLLTGEVVILTRVLRTYRLRKNRCPYCSVSFRTARIRNGSGDRSLFATLCPDQHSGFLFPGFDPKQRQGVVEWVQIDMGGDAIGIPEERIEWGTYTLPPRK